VGTDKYPSPFTEQYIHVVQIPPVRPPDVEYFNDSSANSNNLRGNLFQFKYKYVYLDNEESAWSPISKVPLPVGEELIPNGIYFSPNVNNGIAVTIETGDAIVKEIKIAARRGNIGDFFLADTLNKARLSIASDSTYVFNFYNDETYSGIDLIERRPNH